MAKRNLFYFLKGNLKADFLSEIKTVNAALALGPPFYGEGSILGIFTARTARLSLAVMDSENGLNDFPT